MDFAAFFFYFLLISCYTKPPVFLHMLSHWFLTGFWLVLTCFPKYEPPSCCSFSYFLFISCYEEMPSYYLVLSWFLMHFLLWKVAFTLSFSSPISCLFLVMKSCPSWELHTDAYIRIGKHGPRRGAWDLKLLRHKYKHIHLAGTLRFMHADTWIGDMDLAEDPWDMDFAAVPAAIHMDAGTSIGAGDMELAEDPEIQRCSDIKPETLTWIL